MPRKYLGEHKRLSLMCPKCKVVRAHYILRRYPGRKVRYDLRCPWCEHVFSSGYPVNFWRWLKSHYELTHEEVRQAQRSAMSDLAEGDFKDLLTREALTALTEGIVRYVEKDLRPKGPPG